MEPTIKEIGKDIKKIQTESRGDFSVPVVNSASTPGKWIPGWGIKIPMQRGQKKKKRQTGISFSGYVAYVVLVPKSEIKPAAP